MKIRKVLSRISAYIPSFVALISILFVNIVPPAIVIAEELLPQDNVIDESMDILDEGISDPESIAKGWVTNGNNAVTSSPVVLGEKYVAPQNSNVSVTFTKLPEVSSTLSITELTLTEEEMNATGAVSNKAYDITTDMENGTFEYDLVLPTVNNNAKVVYVNERQDILTGGIEVDNEIVNENGNIKIKDLDHFTIYIATYGDPDFTIAKSTYAIGETVYVKAGDLDTSKYYKISLTPSLGGNIYSQECFKPTASNNELTFTYVLPNNASLGNWKAELLQYNSSSCRNYASTVKSSAFKVVAVPPVANPALPTEACGLDIALVLDVSGSINATELSQMKNAFIAFVDALSGTPTQFSVTQFGTTARILQPFTSDYAAVKTAINSAGGGDWTNWEDGLNKAWSTYDPRPDKPNLMIFSSDGNPNRIGESGSQASESQALAAAVAVANTIKTAGTRILGLGIGSDLNTDNMIAISGPKVDIGILESDVITSDFARLAQDLGELASRTCGGTITVKKYIDDTSQPAGSGWQFTVSGTSTKNLTTGSDGTANTGKVPAGTYSVVETNMLDGFSYGSAICRDETGATVGSIIPNGWGNIIINDDDIISCDFINIADPLTGTIIVHKSVIGPHGEDINDDQTYSIKLDDGTPQSITDGGTVTFNDVVVGEHTIYETSLPVGSVLVSITPDNDPNLNGAQITLAADETVHVYVTNRKNLPSIYGHKYNDVNANGVYDAGDLPLSGWNIYIDANGNGSFDSGELSTTTNANGEYSFLGLPSGLNTVCEEIQTGWTQSYPKDNNGCHKVTLGALGQSNAVVENIDFLNYETPTLTVIKKVVNDHGGSATVDDFEIKIGNDLITFEEGEVNGSTTTYTSTPSVIANVSYLLTEKNDVTGYTAGSWNCVDNDTGNTVSNPVVLVAGQNVTCTIINDDKAGSIKIIKDVNPDNSSKWNFTVTTPIPGVTYEISDIGDNEYHTLLNLVSGSYTITETSDSNYVTSISCNDGTIANGTSINVDLSLGEELVCTFTNTQKGSISGYKLNDLDNDYETTEDRFGVAGWTIELLKDEEVIVSKVTDSSGYFSFSNLEPATYQLREAIVSGWIKLYPTGDFLTVNLQPGQDSINNNFINVKYASITVLKDVDTNGDKVVDEYDSRDWKWKLDDSDEMTTGTTVSNLLPGTYTISEIVQDNYHVESLICNNGPLDENNQPTKRNYGAVISQDITITSGQDLECTFTNSRNLGTLIVKKIVKNDNGGTLTAKDFSFQVNGETAIQFEEDGENSLSKYAGLSYTITEPEVPGYKTTYNNCTDVVVPFNGTVTCTITNNDIQPKLTVVKEVVNNYGGQAVASNFTMLVQGTNVSSTSFEGSDGTVVTLNAGSYSVDEENYPGYSKSIGANCSGTINIGEEKTCTITNTDIAPTLTLTKIVNNNYGGTKGVSDFPLFIDTTQTTSGTPVTLKSNQEYTVSETNQSGYEPSSWTGDCSADGKITLQPGQKATCTITNNDIQPKLTVVKEVVNNYGGQAVASNFTMLVQGTNVSSTSFEGSDGTVVTLNAGSYSVDEENYPGYSKSIGANCSGTINIGEEKTCTITNTALPGTIIVKKDVTKNDEGEGIFSDANFGVILNGDIEGAKTIRDSSADRIDAVFNFLDAGTYTLNEIQEDGYLFTGCYSEKIKEDYDPLNPEIQLGNGETLTYICRNEVIQPELEIEKLNDTGGLGMDPGDIVTYTIIVKAPEDDVDGKYLLKNVVVTDILPEGFEYVPGSWTRTVNEPVYNGGPAKWEIGDMEEGDVVILTYKAVISTTQEPGLYPDIAWVSGEDILKDSVLGVSTIEPTENFVGTEVLVVVEEELEDGEVLGATTVKTIGLPSTGANILITLGAIVSMILGLILLLVKPKKTAKVLFLASTLLLGINIILTPKPIYAAESDKINVQISQPKTPTNKTSFNIGYVALDLDSRPLTIECLETTYGKYATHNTYSGNCAVDTSVITGSGTYTFTVKATANDGSGDYKISNPVTVVVDLETPAAITNYIKTEGACSYVLSFTTGNKAAKVQIFRSTVQPFTADASTLIKEMLVAPNQTVTYTDTIPVCTQEYFYAVRSVDGVNNMSAIVTDPIIKTVEVQEEATTPVQATTPATTTLAATEKVEESEDAEVKGEEETTEDTDKVVEKKDTEKEDEQEDKDEKKNYIGLIVLIAILLAGAVGYRYVKNKKATY